MEHRYSSRRSLRLEIQVWVHGSHVSNCFSRDVSFTGIFLELPATFLGVDDSIDMEFFRDTSDAQWLTGIVVRRHPDGIGLLYNDYNPQNMHVLSNLLFYPRLQELREKPALETFYTLL